MLRAISHAIWTGSMFCSVIPIVLVGNRVCNIFLAGVCVCVGGGGSSITYYSVKIMNNITPWEGEKQSQCKSEEIRAGGQWRGDVIPVYGCDREGWGNAEISITFTPGCDTQRSLGR